MQQLYRELARIAASEAAVLITGESGTGKELVAQALHAYSRRATGPFVPVNCPALPPTLLESADGRCSILLQCGRDLPQQAGSSFPRPPTKP